MEPNQILDSIEPKRNVHATRYPIYVFWGLIPVIILYSYLFMPEKTIDIQMHDTYFVIEMLLFRIFVCVYFGFIGFVYLLLQNYKLVKTFTFLHIFLTLIFLTSAANYYMNIIPSFAGIVHIYIVLIFLGVNVLFLMNNLIGILRGKYEV